MAKHFLVVAEQSEGTLRKVSLEMLAEARRLASSGGKVEAVLLGSGIETLAEQLAWHGADKVYLADDPALQLYTAEAYTAVLADLVRKVQPEVIFIGATTNGRDLAPRLATRLGVGLASDCTAFSVDGDGKLLITRPIYAGRAIETIKLKSMPQMATLRPNVFPPLEPDTSRKAEVEKIPVNVGEVRARVVGFLKKEGEEIELTEADIIVSGGRGLGGPDGFNTLRELAKVLGAAVGASRAAVDAGWIDHSHQVGQTGKTVNPKLYIACGISGAAQHLAGMRTSKVIVAINKDPEAPIFKVADYGIVGDLYQIVPILTKALRETLQG
ncbi:MAG: electron transfer flavoprotein subunit alpha/FixB family protein [Anaerolineae bacterium]|nr:electron transfer flavoprotein subunit alpha/FixB family protein [Anaerolineae bacterium]MDW8101697.1 electron transfer flavoprotein subunit alpha/FixB family protein [Anaerolineae bacterium]